MIAPSDMTDTTPLLRLVPWACVSTCVLVVTLLFQICVSITTLTRSIAGHLDINVTWRIKRSVKMGRVYNAMSVTERYKRDRGYLCKTRIVNYQRC